MLSCKGKNNLMSFNKGKNITKNTDARHNTTD